MQAHFIHLAETLPDTTVWRTSFLSFFKKQNKTTKEKGEKRKERKKNGVPLKNGYLGL